MSDIPTRRIRQALPSEVKHLSELAFRSKSYWGYSDRFMQACLKELTLDQHYIASNPTFVIEVEKSAIGFYSLEYVSASEAELGYLFVEPTFIGKGYGRKLMAHAQQEARHLGYNQMIIQGDPNAEQFYRAAGGSVVGTRKSTSIPDRELPVFRMDLRESEEET